MSPFSQPVMRPCLTIVDSGSPLTISVFTAVICFTVISKSTKHVPLRTLYTTVPALTQSELMTASPEYASTIPWSDKLVLSTDNNKKGRTRYLVCLVTYCINLTLRFICSNILLALSAIRYNSVDKRILLYITITSALTGAFPYAPEIVIFPAPFCG